MRALVEGFAPDAVALARHLAHRGDDVVLVGTGTAPAGASALRAAGVDVRGHTDLDTAPLPDPPADVAYLDVWTAETAPRAHRLRAAGVRLSCLSDLLLAEAAIPTLGVTGTAGKTTTASFTAQLLRSAGIDTHASTTARLGNLWATEELLDVLHPAAAGIAVIELTSSHLAFCSSSPSIAVVTSFWPDHLELHGSLAAYRRAKRTIVAHQSPADHVIVNLDDPEAVELVDDTPGRRWQVSARGEVDHGVALRRGEIVACAEGGQAPIAESPADLDAPRLTALLAACAAALAAGATTDAIGAAIPHLRAPSHRATIVGRRGETALVDDCMAATPAKAAATLARYPAGSVVLVAGGELESGSLPVHDTPEERALIADAALEAARAAKHVVLFGRAAGRLADALEERGCTPQRANGLDDAIRRGLAAASGAEAVVVSPMFPLAAEDRARVPGLLTRRE